MRELLNKDKLHHAYVLEGEREHIYEKICQFCEEDLKLAIKANPDFWYQESDKFLIQNARDLREMQLRKTLGDSRKIFIIAFNFITREAQNSLLKVLEEPTEGTHIFIITPSSSVFLDTVLSRVIVLKNEEGEGTTDAKKFLNATYGERINMVTKLVKDIKAEKASKAVAIRMVKDLKNLLHKDVKRNSRSLIELNKTENYLHDNSASVKMLLEHTAIILD